MTRSDLHVVTRHDGSSWLEDTLVEGDYGPTVRYMLGGEPEHTKVLIPGVSQAFYRGSASVMVLTFAPDVDRRQAEVMVHGIGEHREDVN